MVMWDLDSLDAATKAVDGSVPPAAVQLR